MLAKQRHDSQRQAPALGVFVSYSRTDADTASNIVKALEPHGIACTIDSRDLPYGEKWQGELRSFIKAADAVVFLVSSHSVGSKWCKWELAQVATLSKRLVPVEIERVPVEELPAEIAEVHLFPFLSALPFNQKIASLANALKTDLPWLKEHTRLSQLSDRWQSTGRKGDLLLRGSALAEIETWMIGRPATAPPPGTLQLDFIAACQLAAKRRARRWSIGIGSVALTAAALAVTAEVNRREANSARSVSEQLLDGGRTVATDIITDSVQRFRRTSGVPPDLVGAILSDLVKLVDTLQEKGGGRPGLEQARALSYIELSSVQRSNGELDTALQSARAAVQILESLERQHPTLPALTADLVAAYDRLGDAEAAKANSREAAAAYTQGRDRALHIEQAAGATLESRLWLANALTKMSSSHANPEELDAAIATNSEAMQILAGVRERFADDPRPIDLFGTVLERQGDLLHAKQELDAARRHYEDSLSSAERLSRLSPSNMSYARSSIVRRQKLGDVLLEQDDRSAAVSQFREADASIGRLWESNKGNLEVNLSVLNAAVRLAAAVAPPDHDVAAASLRGALRATDEIGKQHGGNLPLTRLRAFASIRLAEISASMGRHAEAEAAFAFAVKLLEELPIASLSTDDGLNDLTGLYDKASRFLNAHRASAPASAKTAYDYSVRRYEALKRLGALSSPDRNRRALGDTSWYALFARQYEAALTAANEALAVPLAGDDAAPIWIVANKAHATLLLGRIDEAMQVYRSLLSTPKGLETVTKDLASLRASGVDARQLDAILSRISEAQAK